MYSKFNRQKSTQKSTHQISEASERCHLVILSFVKIEIRHPKFRHNIINIYIYYIVSNDRVSKTKMTK